MQDSPNINPHDDAERPLPEGMIETGTGLIIIPHRKGVSCVLAGRRIGGGDIEIYSSLED